MEGPLKTNFGYTVFQVERSTPESVQELSAVEGHYEADPKGGLPKACPAPVTQAAPALPGSVTLLKPQGERLPQRPRPRGPQPKPPPEGLPGAARPPPRPDRRIALPAAGLRSARGE